MVFDGLCPATYTVLYGLRNARILEGRQEFTYKSNYICFLAALLVSLSREFVACCFGFVEDHLLFAGLL